MTNEEKLNFASTLGAMLPYKVWCRFKDVYSNEFMDGVLFSIDGGDTFKFYNPNKPYRLYTATLDEAQIMPYLRPINSMDSTEETSCNDLLEKYDEDKIYRLIDWLNEKKFDYKNWIENDMALPMSELKIDK